MFYHDLLCVSVLYCSFPSLYYAAFSLELLFFCFVILCLGAPSYAELCCAVPANASTCAAPSAFIGYAGGSYESHVVPFVCDT